jgi:hypothetical protein
VLAAGGRPVGRVTDLIAEARGEPLYVPALLVGPVALLRRLTFKRMRLWQAVPPRTIPWQLVERIDEVVHLRPVALEVEMPNEDEATLVAARSPRRANG